MLIIDVSSVSSEAELHGLLQRKFGFPDFYGRNWDAFWDAVTGLVEIPGRVRFVGWPDLVGRLPRGGRMLRLQLGRYRDAYRPDLVVEYT
ncbi:barstar family protein [Streptomyces sp. T-3]|nr:barstar family protein [Streptomyces sp. T-3]